MYDTGMNPGDAFVLKHDYHDQQWNKKICLIMILAVSILHKEFHDARYVYTISIYDTDRINRSRYHYDEWVMLQDSLVKL